MLGALFNTDKIVSDTIQNSLKELAIELKVSEKELFVMIKPKNEEFDFSFYLYKIIAGEVNPKFIREVSLKEILGKE